MKIVLIHGFNVKDGGARTVDRLAPYLQAAGHEVETDEADYGYYNLIKVRMRKHSAVGRIAKALLDADAVISHSNGSNYEYKALKLLAHKDKVYQAVRLSPALNRSTGVPANVSQCTVFHTATDKWVWLSGLLWFHPWGRQGQKGYKGDDPRVRNWPVSDLIKGHSDYFTDENIEFIAGEILLALEHQT